MHESPPADRQAERRARRPGGWGFYVYACAALVVGVLALLPLRNDALLSTSDLDTMDARDTTTDSSYADAVREISAQFVADRSAAVPEARSIFLSHGSRTHNAAILLHGITNSPRQFHPFAQRLYAEGYNVWVPRLPHHGEPTGGAKNLDRLTAEELRSVGESSVRIGHGLGDTIVVVGLSAGGTVAAWVAQHLDVDRVVIVAPALELDAVPSALTDPLIALAVRVPDVTRNEKADTNERDREPGWTTRGIGQMLRLGVAVRDEARERRPAAREIVFLLNANDRTIKARPVLELAKQWSSRGTAVAIYEFPGSLHLAHDVIDPREQGADTAAVYPVLDALVGSGKPDRVVRRLSVAR